MAKNGSLVSWGEEDTFNNVFLRIREEGLIEDSDRQESEAVLTRSYVFRYEWVRRAQSKILITGGSPFWGSQGKICFWYVFRIV